MGSSATEVERLLQTARLELARGELQEAVGRATEAIRLNPKEPAAYLVRAEALRRLKHSDRALADLAVAIRLEPQQSGPYVIRAEILKRRNHFDQAIADATVALTHDPRNVAAFSIRAECRAAIGDQEGANEDVQEVLLIDPTRPVPTFKAGTGSTSSDVEMHDERFWKQAGRTDPKQQADIFSDGKPVDKSYRSHPVVSDEDAPEALGAASGYKPETIDEPIPRIGGRSKRSLGNGGGAILVIGVAIVAVCGIWMVFRGASELATSPKPADPESPKLVGSHGAEATPALASPAPAERPRPVENVVGKIEQPSPVPTVPDSTTEGIEGSPVVRDLGSFSLNKSGRNWNVVMPEHFTKAEVAFYTGDPSGLSLHPAYAGHLKINGKDVVRWKEVYTDGASRGFVFPDSTTNTEYDPWKTETVGFLDVTKYLRPGDNAFYYYHEQRPDLQMGVILRITGGRRASGSGDTGSAPDAIVERAEPDSLGGRQNGPVVPRRRQDSDRGSAGQVTTLIQARWRSGAAPGFANVTEINTKGTDFSPCFSPDGLTIYWVIEPPGAEGEIWTAHRKDARSFFTGKRQIGYGRHIAVSSDGLTILLIARRTDNGGSRDSIQVARRRTTDEEFGRSQEVTELSSINRPRNLFLSQDGLTLLFNEGADSTFQASMTTRSSVQSPWETPRALPISSQVKIDGDILCPYLTKDGLTLFCTVQNAVPRFVFMSRQTTDQPFANLSFVTLRDIRGFSGWTPRYVEATNEFFFCFGLHSPTDSMDIWVVQNFQAVLPFAVHGGLARERSKAAPEIANLTEINTKNNDNCPWLSPDGLTIYWVMEPPGAEGEIWTAHRKDPGSLFTDKRLVGYGNQVAVSSDGLTMFLIARRGDGRPGASIHLATRRSIDESFGRSQEVPELRSIPRPYNLFLAQDGLTLLFKEGDASGLSMATRSSVQSPWETPRALPISSRVKFDGIVRCPYLTKDGLIAR